MGLFDKFLGAAKEIAEGTKTALENIEKEMNQEVNNTKSVDEERYKNPPESFPAVPVQAKLHGHKRAKRKDIQTRAFFFRLPGIIVLTQ